MIDPERGCEVGSYYAPADNDIALLTGAELRAGARARPRERIYIHITSFIWLRVRPPVSTRSKRLGVAGL